MPITKVARYSTYWGIDVSGVSYGTQSLLKSAAASMSIYLRFCCSSFDANLAFVSVVDTGTTLIYIPQNGAFEICHRLRVVTAELLSRFSLLPFP